MIRHSFRFGCLLASALVAPLGLAVPQYPYQSGTLNQWIQQSLQSHGGGSPGKFYEWMDQRLVLKSKSTWANWIRSNRVDSTDVELRTAQELATVADLHRNIKRAIPSFSLDRGFEFANVIQRGERQCFLQSVIGASLLQSCGIRAGVVMVNRNKQGTETNNAHAVILVKLSNGRDVMSDISEPLPLSHPLGVFAFNTSSRSYQFMDVGWDQKASEVTRYQRGKSVWSPSVVDPLPIRFITSQFEFYRGERAPEGVLAQKSSRQGLERSAMHLGSSVATCPQNAPAIYLLAKTYAKLGKASESRKMLARAKAAYAAAGWTPSAVQATR